MVTPTVAAVRVDVNTGPAASYAGLRECLGALRAAGADFGDLPARHASEWAELFPADCARNNPPLLEEIALAPSERRLHRESEQVYRVLSVAAAALCAGTAELGRPLLVNGVGGTDLSSLRGLMRAVEHSRVVPGAALLLHAPESVRAPLGRHADYRAERIRCLRRMNVPITTDDLVADLPTDTEARFEPVTEEGQLYRRARDGDSSAVDRVAASLAYCRRAFFSANWEGMAVVADAAIDLLSGIPEPAIPELLAKAEREEELVHAIEFETAILRSTADIRGFLLKVLGIQAGFRGDQEAAITAFRAIRERGDGLSPEIRAQSHLYAALTLSKRKHHLAEAIAEVEQGFEVVRERPDEADSVRRERGWLHNLRGLTLFAERRLGAAFEHEKQALACLADLTDASSAHLRINLYSNISVLQEKAGKHWSALRTWEKFQQATGSSNAGFAKHHAYRSAGLRLLVGDRDAALEDLDTTLTNAAELNDVFHQAEVRLELGKLHATAGDREAAAEEYVRAENTARLLGDPYRIALAQAGQVMTGGASTVARSAVANASLSLTRPTDAETLATAVAGGKDLAGLLPAPRTKLNRPFDLINFQD
ncbi:hypothetical protein QTQ03_07500 [Micromonospora sp. WMMA1363]|uniref:hypothetical protein n=1 Tax=Micromonospora sp. WMMA1363 TaxID=3053985 RepID=UPI00259CEDDB|nr:hypothetical protein [Micromonospora sp. WMMA1363]MDM4719450.1 hypothetical protein [Micromonospora sp. WMMA1363]